MRLRKSDTATGEILKWSMAEHGSFSPLVFSPYAAYGGNGREAERFLTELALKLSEKKRMEYSIVIHWLRAKLSSNLTAVRHSEHSWILFAVNVVLFCCCFVMASCLGHLKGKCMTKLMKVCIRNNQSIDSWKCASTETLDKDKKTLITVFRCWPHCKNKRTKSSEPFEPPFEAPKLSSIVFVFKLSICVVALSSFVLEIAVFTCSTVSFRSLKKLLNFIWQRNAKVWKSNSSSILLFICKV